MNFKSAISLKKKAHGKRSKIGPEREDKASRKEKEIYKYKPSKGESPTL
jgi:hypothetical protein